MKYPTEWGWGKPRGSIKVYKDQAYKVVMSPPKEKQITKFFTWSRYATKEKAMEHAKKFALEESTRLGLIRNQIRYLDKDTIEVKLTQDKTMKIDSKYFDKVEEFILITNTKKEKGDKQDKYYVNRMIKKKQDSFWKEIYTFRNIKYLNGNPLDLRECNVTETGHLADAVIKIKDDNASEQYSYFNINYKDLPQNKWLLGKPVGTIFVRKNDSSWTVVVGAADDRTTKTFSFKKHNRLEVYEEAKKWQITTSYMRGLTKNLVKIRGDIIEVALNDDETMITDTLFLEFIQENVLYYNYSSNGIIFYKNSKIYRFDQEICKTDSKIIHKNGDLFDNRLCNLAYSLDKKEAIPKRIEHDSLIKNVKINGSIENYIRYILQRIFRTKFPRIELEWIKKKTNLILSGYSDKLKLGFYHENKIGDLVSSIKLEKICRKNKVKLILLGNETNKSKIVDNIFRELGLKGFDLNEDLYRKLKYTETGEINDKYVRHINDIAKDQNPHDEYQKLLDKVIKPLIDARVFPSDEARREHYFKLFWDLAHLRGGTVFAELQDYKTAHTKLEIMCHDGHMFWISWDCLRSGSWCPTCNIHTSQAFCTSLFEYLTGKVFKTIRPKWLMGDKGVQLELDGYNKELNIAFEYNGMQHYEYCYFHKDRGDYINQIKRDLKKERLCRQKKLALMHIPYNWSNEEIIKNVIEWLTTMRVPILVDTSKINPKHILKFQPTFNKLKGIIEARRGKIVDGIYEDQHSVFTIKCKKGHLWKAKSRYVMRGDWCPECSAKKRKQEKNSTI